MDKQDAYLTSASIRDRYSISTATLYRWQHDKGLAFPKPFIVKRRKLFKLSDLLNWEQSRTLAMRPEASNEH